MLSIYATLQTLGFKVKNRLQRDETGATAVEYGIMVGLIAVVIIAGLVVLGPKLSTLFTEVGNKMPAVSSTTTTTP